MPPEIADSDAETDYEESLPPRSDEPRSVVPASETPNSKTVDDSYRPFEIDFNQFLTQSGTSQHSVSQNGPPKPGTGSIDKLLRGIGDAQHDLAGSSSNKALSAIKTQQMQSLISPSQRSSPTQSLNVTPGPLYAAQLDGSPIDDSRKRRHTEAQGTADQSGEPKRKKGAKTYGNSREQITSSLSDIFNTAGEAETEAQRTPNGKEVPNTMSPPEVIAGVVGPDGSSMPPPLVEFHEDDDEEVFVRQRNRPRRVTSLLNGNATDSNGEVSMTRSSMGEHQSINLDFRGSTVGLDINTNPFGDPSQMSIDGDLDTTERAGFPRGVVGKTSLTRILAGFGDPYGVLPNRQSSREVSIGAHSNFGRLASINPSMLMHLPEDLPHHTQLLSSLPGVSASERRKTHHESAGAGASFSDTLPHINAVPEIESDSPQETKAPKKRGRKLKNQQISFAFPAPMKSVPNELDEDEIAVVLPTGQYSRNPSRSRASIAVSNGNDQAPVDCASKTDKKGKRKPSRATHGTFDEHQSNAFGSPVKEPSSELNLGDEAFIGLPRRIINRDRAAPGEVAKKKRKTKQKDEIDRIDAECNESSPVEQPTSELNRSDEMAIGLPKENYIPRPSRSRSKRIVDKDEEAADQVLGETSKKAEESEAPTTTQKKQGRKAKVKRAKTSAAALLKSQQMFSDGEVDVIFMDEMPTKVKLDLQPEVEWEKVLKQEMRSLTGEMEKRQPVSGDSKDYITVHDDNSETESKVSGSKVPKVNFTIEVPPSLEPSRESLPPEPKKRGRKCKKIAEVPLDAEAAEALPPLNQAVENTSTTASSSESKSRTTLKEKDPNLQPPPTSNEPVSGVGTPSPRKGTEKENTIAAAKLSKTSSPNKPPTKHSPINPPGAKALYRVGLSRRAPIPSLLKIVRKDRLVLAPTAPKRGKKKAKDVDVDVDVDNDAEAATEKTLLDGGDEDDEHQQREADGMGAMRRNPGTGLLEEYISD